jgi:hypothetical protein
LCSPDSALDWKRLFTCFLGRHCLPSMGILAKLKHSLPTCKFGFGQRLPWKDSGVRKKIILFGLLTAGVFWGYSFYLSWAIAFAISKFCGGRENGRPGKLRSVIIPWREYQFHLHHWLLASLVGAISAINGFSLVSPGVFYGFLGGLVFQGLYCYTDWHRIVISKKVLPATLEAEQLSLAAETTQEALGYYG